MDIHEQIIKQHFKDARTKIKKNKNYGKAIAENLIAILDETERKLLNG